MASPSMVAATVATSNSVPMALIMGVIELRIMPQTSVGRVLPPPRVKKVMTKSSSEIAADMSAAPITVGRMIGSVTVRNARHAGRHSHLSEPVARKDLPARLRAAGRGWDRVLLLTVRRWTFGDRCSGRQGGAHDGQVSVAVATSP